MTTDPTTQPAIDDEPDTPDAPTPAEETTPSPAEDTPGNRGKGAYLHALPKGWIWTVRASGPGGAVYIDQNDDGEAFPDGKPVRVRYNVTSGDERVAGFDTFTEAVKSVRDSAKVMAKVHEADRAAERARQESLDVLGEIPGRARPKRDDS